MKSFSYKIKDALGIHARPAGAFVKEASRFQSDIRIQKGEKSVDAKRLFAVMSLGVKQGEEIVVIAEGADEETAITAVELFVRGNL